MATPSWKINGQYFETCSCDFVCACILGRMAVPPTKGSCTFAMALQVERGNYGAVPLDGLAFIVVGFTPEAMGKGNWSVGIVADDRASAEQRDAIAAIASGAAGGPMSALSGLVGAFLLVGAADGLWAKLAAAVATGIGFAALNAVLAGRRRTDSHPMLQQAARRVAAQKDRF